MEFKGLNSAFIELLKKTGISNRFLIKRNGVISLVGVGPLTLGYILIVPENHYYSIGEVPKKILSEIVIQKQQIANIIQKKFGSVICFEHGAVSDKKRGGACIDHAHLHIIPGYKNFRHLICCDFKEMPLSQLDDLKQFVTKQIPYIYIEDIDGKSYSYSIPDKIESQYLRKIWAKVTNQNDQWDWSVFPNYELMKKTFDFFKENLESSTNH